ncbi:Laccase-3, partial [Hortaea werneckii]
MKIFSFLAILCIGGNALVEALPGHLEGRATTSTSTKKTTSTSSVKTSTKTSTATTAKTSSSTSSKATTSLASLASSTSTKTSSATTSTRTADSSCKNTAFTRQCWGNGFSIAADFDNKWPVTGKTRYYDLTFTNGTGSPDGGPSRPLFLINNQFPGPTIYADWGDTVQVTVHNKLEANGTGIHWHGIRQKNSNTEDGVPGITECPLAPGDTKVYTFVATQYGTSWYHSHWSSQYGDGILGAMVINGPATANYDFDLGPLMVMDWYYTPAATLAWRSAHIGGRPATADNALING